jgi:hypothetical protein
MQYLVYFAVATPLLLGWLFWKSATTPPPPPLFHSFADTIHDRAVLQRAAERAWHARQAALARDRRAAAPDQAGHAETASRPHIERTARAEGNPNIKLR